MPVASTVQAVADASGESLGWKLQAAGATLRLAAAEFDRKADDPLDASFVRLANDRIVVEARYHPQDYESLSCFLELEPVHGVWQPRGVGLFFGWCVGFWW